MESKCFEFDGFRVGENDSGPYLLKDGEDLDPRPPQASAVLLALVRRTNQVVSKKELLTAGWGTKDLEENNVEQAIMVLRQKLHDTKKGYPLYIQTVAGRGYKFIGKPVPCELNLERTAPSMTERQEVSMAAENTGSGTLVVNGPLR